MKRSGAIAAPCEKPGIPVIGPSGEDSWLDIIDIKKLILSVYPCWVVLSWLEIHHARCSESEVAEGVNSGFSWDGGMI